MMSISGTGGTDSGGNASTVWSVAQQWRAAAASILMRWRYALIALVAFAQSGVLVYMVAQRETLLANGRVIDLRVVPVDPRDLFRGDYVTLSYDISRVPQNLINGDLRRGDQIYVRLANRQGNWVVAAAGRTRAEAGTAGADEIVLKASAYFVASPVAASERQSNTAVMIVRYGIEKFFVPEGAGRKIEDEVRANEVVAHVAVGADGTAALKGLTVSGTRYDTPPLF